MKVSEKLYAFLWSDQNTNNCNTYLIDGSLKILVDPGHQHLFDRVREEMEKTSIFLDDIDIVILTHGHPDHIEGIKNLAKLDSELLLPGHGNIIRGKNAIQKNFEEIEKTWFGYI